MHGLGGYGPRMDPAAEPAAGRPEDAAASAPQGASSLGEILDAAAEQGYELEFDAELADGEPRVRCPQCDQLSAPASVAQLWTARLEGASDPADMAYVSAVRCPHCRAVGVFIAQYGPTADAADAAVLPLLPEPGDPDGAPDRD